MAKLTAKARSHLKSIQFALPKERKYPIIDKPHAINAKARAAQMIKKGELSEYAKKKIDRKANGFLSNLKKKR